MGHHCKRNCSKVTTQALRREINMEINQPIGQECNFKTEFKDKATVSEAFKVKDLKFDLHKVQNGANRYIYVTGPTGYRYEYKYRVFDQTKTPKKAEEELVFNHNGTRDVTAAVPAEDARHAFQIPPNAFATPHNSYKHQITINIKK